MAHVGDNRNAQKVWVRKTKGMRSLGSPKHTQGEKKRILEKKNGVMKTGFMWGICGGLLRTQ
jgi:hypothetical protein